MSFESKNGSGDESAYHVPLRTLHGSRDTGSGVTWSCLANGIWEPQIRAGDVEGADADWGD